MMMLIVNSFGGVIQYMLTPLVSLRSFQGTVRVVPTTDTDYNRMDTRPVGLGRDGSTLGKTSTRVSGPVTHKMSCRVTNSVISRRKTFFFFFSSYLG